MQLFHFRCYSISSIAVYPAQESGYSHQESTHELRIITLHLRSFTSFLNHRRTMCHSAKTKHFTSRSNVWLLLPAHKAQDTETGGTQKSEGKTPLDRHYCWCCCRPVVASIGCSLEPAAGPDAALANPSAAPSAPGTSSANPQHCS